MNVSITLQSSLGEGCPKDYHTFFCSFNTGTFWAFPTNTIVLSLSTYSSYFKAHRRGLSKFSSPLCHYQLQLLLGHYTDHLHSKLRKELLVRVLRVLMTWLGSQQYLENKNAG